MLGALVSSDIDSIHDDQSAMTINDHIFRLQTRRNQSRNLIESIPKTLKEMSQNLLNF